MPRLLLLLLTTFLINTVCWQKAQAVDVSVSYATFNSPQGPFIELYFYYIANTLQFESLPDSKQQQARVEVLILFKQEEQIIKFDKYQLSSPAMTEIRNFLDLKRYALPNGEYQLSISITDLADSTNTQTYAQPIQMDYPSDGLSLSDIELLQSVSQDSLQGPLTKNGLKMEPLAYNFYHKKSGQLIFYAEVYNTDKVLGDAYLVRYLVNWKVGNGRSKTLIIGHKRMEPGPVNPLLIQRDISKIPSGNYELAVEIRNRANELLTTKTVAFQRSNPYLDVETSGVSEEDIAGEFVDSLDAETLEYSLRALTPIIRQDQTDILNRVTRKKDDLNVQRKFLFTYWAARDPVQPEIAYRDYMQVAKAVDDKFGDGFGYGFETDRGYIYMKYGQPDDIVKVDNDPVAPPYRIWVYYDFPQTRQTNVKFLFYNESLASNQFRLLHSTAQGEIQNRQWQLELYRNAPNEMTGNNRVDGTEVNDGYFRLADQYFNDF